MLKNPARAHKVENYPEGRRTMYAPHKKETAMVHKTPKNRYLQRNKKQTKRKRTQTVVGQLRVATGAHAHRIPIERKATVSMKATARKRNRTEQRSEKGKLASAKIMKKH